MKKRLIKGEEHYHSGYGAGDGTTEYYEYACPCGKGRIIEEHDNIPGFREHDVYITCSRCSQLFDLNVVKGVRNWKLDGFFIKGLTNAKIRLDEQLNSKGKLQEILVELFEFLSWSFALREKLQLKEQDNSLFFSLKDVLNLLKHDYDLIKLNFIIEKNSTLNDTNADVYIFGNIDNLNNVGENRLKRYKENIENKNIQAITKLLFDDTIKEYNKQY